MSVESDLKILNFPIAEAAMLWLAYRGVPALSRAEGGSLGYSYMKILSANSTSIQKAVTALKAGQLIIYPTDTAYALGADCLNKEAIEIIQKVKGRLEPKPLALVAADLAQVESIAEMTATERRLAHQWWPAPLTLLLKKRPFLPSELTLSRPKVGIRIPSHKFCRDLCRLFGRPIIATSANLTGQGPIYDPMIIKKVFKSSKEVAWFIDGGKLPEVAPSTVIEMVGRRSVVHRAGPVKVRIEN